MDETDSPQTPPELLVILAALADEKVRLQTIAPKFTGRFNKGVDYEGDLAQFERKFNDDLAVIAHAVGRYGLPLSAPIALPTPKGKTRCFCSRTPDRGRRYIAPLRTLQPQRRKYSVRIIKM